MFQIDDRRFNRLAISGLTVGFVLLLAALVGALASFAGTQRSAQLVRHTYQVVDTISQLDLQLERAENGRRGFLLTPTPYRLETYTANAALAPDSLDQLASLIGDNPKQMRRLARLRILVTAELDDLVRSVELASSGRVDEARQAFASNASSKIRGVRALSDEMREAEYLLLSERSAAERHTASLVNWVLGATGLLLFLVGAAAFLLVRRYTSDLTQTRDRLNVLNTNLEGAVAERTADLQRANDEIQRFAYIVSHDLRSPLVNVMGFTAELETTNATLGGLIERAEREAPAIVTEDVRHAQSDLPEAIGFIRSSTQKMDRLINAILKLSREGRRTLTPELLPMERILSEIVASMEHRLIETGAEITIEAPIPDLVSDRVAVEQVFSNLLENAVKYLQPGRAGAIVVRGHKQSGRVIYRVQDNGRGIDPRDHQRIFDLFRRSGTQDQPGEGIGLAHVRATIYRLGGTIDVESTLGEGSTFRLSLPETYLDQGVAE